MTTCSDRGSKKRRVTLTWNTIDKVVVIEIPAAGGGHACEGGCKQKGREGGGLKRTREGRGRLGAHRSSRLVMALHCGGRVPVSWLERRDLRTGGGCACAGGCKQKGREGGGLNRIRAGRGRLGAHS